MPAAMAKDKACSDIASTTQISPALTQRLQECGLSQLQVLLEIRGICTVEDLAKLDACESTILLQKARKIYEILGLASSPLFFKNIIVQMIRWKIKWKLNINNIIFIIYF